MNKLKKETIDAMDKLTLQEVLGETKEQVIKGINSD